MLRSMKPLWLQTPAQLPNHLRSFRKARGLTQAALGALTGLDQTRIAKMERDPKRVSVGQLLQQLSVWQLRGLPEPVRAAPRSGPRARALQEERRGIPLCMVESRTGL